MLRLEEVKDIEVLRQAAVLLEAENRRLVAKVVELTQQLAKATGTDATSLQMQIAELEAQLAQRNKMLFSPSSEKREGPPPVPPADPKPPQRGHGPHVQAALPIVEQVHELDEQDRQCPRCGGDLGEMKGQYEESEEIDVIERHFVVKKHKRKKYRCSCNGCIETALGPPKLFEGARYSIDFAIEVAVQKYLDHAPLERQVRIMLREGLVVNSQTLWDYLDALARLLAPAHEALHAYILSQKVIGADETRWRLMGAGGQDEGESKLWQAWAVAAPDAVCYRILASRSAQAGSEVLSGFSGILMADGYGVYKKLARGGGAFVLVHCWAHVRREFIEVEKNFPQVSEVLILIAELYVIESACPPGPAANEPRASLRNERSRPVVARIESWALTQRTKVLPESGLSKAIEYMLGMWAGLTRFIDDPRIPLDNNATERALRGLVVGRKNHYGSRSKRGTEVAALLYSLMESAKLVGIDPKAYLRRATHAALGGLPIPLPHEMAVPG